MSGVSQKEAAEDDKSQASRQPHVILTSEKRPTSCESLTKYGWSRNRCFRGFQLLVDLVFLCLAVGHSRASIGAYWSCTARTKPLGVRRARTPAQREFNAIWVKVVAKRQCSRTFHSCHYRCLFSISRILNTSGAQAFRFRFTFPLLLFATVGCNVPSHSQ